jgi:hypothetical protein
VNSQAVIVADTTKLYVLGFTGDTLANPQFDLQMNGDNTINTVGLTSTSQGQAALTQLGTEINAVNVANAADKTAKQTAAQKVSDAFATAQADYYAKEQAYCTASNATPKDLSVIRTAAANVYASETTLVRTNQALPIPNTLPFGQIINPATDIGVGCPVAAS